MYIVRKVTQNLAGHRPTNSGMHYDVLSYQAFPSLMTMTEHRLSGFPVVRVTPTRPPVGFPGNGMWYHHFAEIICAVRGEGCHSFIVVGEGEMS